MTEHSGGRRKALLTGLLYCGWQRWPAEYTDNNPPCGCPLEAGRVSLWFWRDGPDMVEQRPRYRCRPGGHLSISARQTERLIVAVVEHRLGHPLPAGLEQRRAAIAGEIERIDVKAGSPGVWRAERLLVHFRDGTTAHGGQLRRLSPSLLQATRDDRARLREQAREAAAEAARQRAEQQAAEGALALLARIESHRR